MRAWGAGGDTEERGPAPTAPSPPTPPTRRAGDKRGENPFLPPDTRTELEKTVDKSFPQSPGLWKPDREGAREIWNTNWRKELQGWEGAKEREAAFAARREAPAELGTGYLSFSRVAELDNMDLDLTSGLSSRGEGVAEE